MGLRFQVGKPLASESMIGAHKVVIEDCILGGLVIHMKGTNDTGVTRALAHGGSFQFELIKGGKTFQMGSAITFKEFYEMNERLAGLVVADSTVSSSFEFMVGIPFSHPHPKSPDANAIHLEGDDRLEFWIPDLNALAAVDSSATNIVRVYAMPSTAPFRYLPQFLHNTMQFKATLSEEVPAENIAMLQLKLASGASAPDSIGIRKRGQLVHDDSSPWSLLVATSNAKYSVEAAPAAAVALIDFCEEGVDDAVGKTRIESLGGSGDLEWLSFGRKYVGSGLTARSTKAAVNARTTVAAVTSSLVGRAEVN